MAEKCSETRGDGRLGSEVRRYDHGGRALEHVAKERRRGEPLAAGAQDIGCADIARADRADIGSARCARQQKPEWNGAEQIAEDEGERGGHTYS